MTTHTPVRLLSVSLLGLALAGAACGYGPRDASGDVADGPAASDAIQVVAFDNNFDPSAVEVEAGTEVSIEVTNKGDTPHNFVIDGLDLSTGTIDAGEVVTASFTVPEGGVQFECTFHPGMTGKIEAT